MIKGQSGGIYFELWDNTTNSYKIGDVENLTVQISVDGGVLQSVEQVPIEIGDGVYYQPLTDIELDADIIVLIISSTSIGVVTSHYILETVPPSSYSIRSSTVFTRKPVTVPKFRVPVQLLGRFNVR